MQSAGWCIDEEFNITEKMQRRYSFKLYPTPRQDMELSLQARMVASLWNAMLEIEEQQYRRTGGQKRVMHADGKSFLSEYDLGYQVTALLAQSDEWRALSTWTPRRVAKALSLAFAAFFRRAKGGAGKSAGYPKYRRVRFADWVPHRFASGCKLTHDDGTRWRLRLKGITADVTARGKFPEEPLDWADADIRRDATGTWWLSVCVEMHPRMPSGDMARRVAFDGIDKFASVDGVSVYAHELGIENDPRIEQLQKRMATLKSEQRWPEYHAERVAKARLQDKAKRRRRELLHAWTTDIVRAASEIEMTAPASVKEATASGHGDEKEWGAATDTKALFNRAVLDQSPAAAAAMIRYKAAEGGVELREVKSAHLGVGNMLVAVAKAARIVRRRVKELEEVTT